MAIKVLSKLLGRTGLVLMKCRRCGIGMGWWPYSGIASALCVGCQKLEVDEAELRKQKQVDTTAGRAVPQQTVFTIPGENFVVVTGPPPPEPEVKTAENDFEGLVKKLMTRGKRKK